MRYKNQREIAWRARGWRERVLILSSNIGFRPMVAHVLSQVFYNLILSTAFGSDKGPWPPRIFSSLFFFCISFLLRNLWNILTYVGKVSIVAFPSISPDCKVDIGILMDESGSVNAEDWVRQKNFVKDLSDHFKFGSNAARMGVISFSTYAHLDIQLNSNSNGNSFKQAVDRISQAREYEPRNTRVTLDMWLNNVITLLPVILSTWLDGLLFVFLGGWTYTAKALDLAYNGLFHSSKGARSNVARVNILLKVLSMPSENIQGAPRLFHHHHHHHRRRRRRRRRHHHHQYHRHYHHLPSSSYC